MISHVEPDADLITAVESWHAIETSLEQSHAHLREGEDVADDDPRYDLATRLHLSITAMTAVSYAGVLAKAGVVDRVSQQFNRNGDMYDQGALAIVRNLLLIQKK